ncbi:hypothetical protein TrVE_jg12039 [Triparma verrucosa]|uniref:Uncharacterized protein n=1 Tax=Triparma verrucosa TaxID=1606542 RepID=A0A9W7C811_9STRA|nr:hypothetical protein TrVE_jg12039 [Triparma verrucosa]
MAKTGKRVSVMPHMANDIVVKKTKKATVVSKRRGSILDAMIPGLDRQQSKEKASTRSSASSGMEQLAEETTEEPEEQPEEHKAAVYHSEAANVKLSKRFRFLRLCCGCLFPKELFHRIEQRAIGFQQHVAGLEENETLIHYQNPNDFRAKYSHGDPMYDEEGKLIEYADNKNPTEEELQLYHLRAVSDLSIRDSGGVDSNADTTLRRRFTFSRSDSDITPESSEGLSATAGSASTTKRHRRKSVVEKKHILQPPDPLKLPKEQRPKKSVRVFPIVRITITHNYENYDIEDWDIERSEECMRGMEKGDLWFSKRDIASFRKMVKYDNELFSLSSLRRKSKNALIWFQTFGKFFGECGEDFTEEHEETIFGKPINEIIDFDDEFFYEDTLDLIKESPVEYIAWESGQYYKNKPTHSSLTFSSFEDLPSHSSFTEMSKKRGISRSTTDRISRLQSIQEKFSSVNSMDSSMDSDEMSFSEEESEDEEQANTPVRDYGENREEKKRRKKEEKKKKTEEKEKKLEHEIVRRSSSITALSIPAEKQQQLLAAAQSKLNTSEAPPPSQGKSPAASDRKVPYKSKFMDLADDVDMVNMHSKRGESFRKGSGGPPSLKKFAHRDQSLRDLLSEENMNRGVPMRKEYEVQMDNTGAATIFTPKQSEKKSLGFFRAKVGEDEEVSPRSDDEDAPVSSGENRILKLQSVVESGREGESILSRRHQAPEPQTSKDGKRLTL